MVCAMHHFRQYPAATRWMFFEREPHRALERQPSPDELTTTIESIARFWRGVSEFIHRFQSTYAV